MTRRSFSRTAGFLAAILALSRPIHGQELSFGWGALSTPDSDGGKGTYTWQIDYRHNFLNYLAWSASWINEGHIQDHHRDGFATQLWGRLPLSGKRVSLAFGVGVDRYFDTQPDGQGNSADVHGWAPIYSLSATYSTLSPWLYRATYNRISPDGNIRTNSIQVVVGYKLWETSEDPRHQPEEHVAAPSGRTTDHEFTAFIGKTVVNTFNSEDDTAYGMEYRKGIAKYCDWTVSFINEGNPEVIRRNGFGTQVWLVNAFLNERLAIGIGGGIYLNIDQKHQPVPGEKPQRDISGLLGPTISYRISERWLTRLNWNRVVSDYNRDSDVFLLGLGYRWGNS
jgi:hypothetical protein